MSLRGRIKKEIINKVYVLRQSQTYKPLRKRFVGFVM